MNSFTRPMAAALAALALAAYAVPNASLRKNETNVKPEGTVVDDVRRPVPTEFETGNTYDDILFFDDEKDPLNSSLLAALPEGRRLADDSAFLTYAGSLTSDDVRTVEISDVEGEYFTKALKFDLAKENDQLYGTRFDFSSPVTGGEEGESAYVHISLHSYNRDIYLYKMMCQIQLILKDENGQKLDSIAGDTADYTMWGYDWLDYYIPFTVPAGLATVEVKVGWIGRYGETASMGGFEIVGYGKDVALEELPHGVDMQSLEKDASWRKEAWERIEQIRKGGMNIAVVDKNGKPVKNAEVDVNMYEHDFKFGSAINTKIISESEEGDKYRKAVEINFNAAVLENHTKWKLYESDPSIAKNMYEKLLELGINKLRGHVLIWDKSPDTTGSKAPDYMDELENDRDAYQSEVKRHINEITADLRKYMNEWDVLNEAIEHHYIQDIFGNDIVVEWFDMAREALGDEGVLYYNDFVITHELFEKLDLLKEQAVDYDGIGIQSHLFVSTYLRSPEILYDFYDQMEERYGKRLKITEFSIDLTKDKITDEYMANYFRDFLISAFSHESMDAFMFWWFKDTSETTNHCLYDINWNLKKAGEVWQDLVYNKWWTRESLTTDENGKVSLRGFYGDYDVTVTTADGRTKTVSIPLHKGEESSFIIVID